MADNDKPPRPRFPRYEPPRTLGILDGIKVIDFTRMMSGPVATQMLGDFGADVVKVENPAGGDDTRLWAPMLDGQSGSFLSCNRNKASITLDLKDPADLVITKALIRKADVLVENFAGGVMDRLGLGYDACVALNPPIIYCSISGYGKDGMYRGRPGFDAIFQAESGLMSVTGDPAGEPMRTGTPVTDYSTGIFASSAIMAALYHRQRTGEGQFVEIAMFDVALNLLGNFGMNYLISGIVPTRHGNTAPLASPAGLVQASDGYINLSCANDRLFQKLARLLDRMDMLEDERFRDNAARVKNRPALMSELNAIMGTKTVDEWMKQLIDASIPAGAIHTLDQAYGHPFVQERRTVTEIKTSKGGTVPTVANPIKFSKTPTVVRRSPPELGEDNAMVARLFRD